MAYVSVEDFEAAVSHLGLDLPDDVAGLLQRASQDIDSHTQWPLPVLDPEADPPATFDRIDPAALGPFAADCLRRATIAQAAYRCSQGEDALAEGRPQILSLPGLQLARDAPDVIGPAAIVALAGGGLLRYRTGTAPADGPAAA